MIEITAYARKWGRSVGVVIPKENALKAHLKSGDRVRLLILNKEDPVKKTFGIFKFKKSTEQIMHEIDEDGYDE